MEVVIQGDKHRITRLMKELRLRFKRDNLKVSITDTDDVLELEVSDPIILNHWKDVLKEISDTDNLEDLKKFESDKRPSIVKALKAKQEELK